MAGAALGLDRAGHALDEGADRLAARGDEAEDVGLGPAAALAGAAQHDLAQFGHQHGIVARGVEEGVARQGQNVAVAQGDHIRHVRRARQHGQFADRLARLDDGGHLRNPRVVAAEDAQTPGAQKIEGVGRIADREQPLASRQGEPAGAAVPRVLEGA